MPTLKSPLKTERTPTGLLLQPKGDLVASTVEALRAQLLSALEGASGTVALDISRARQIDSLGVTLVLGLFKSCQAKGLAFRVEGAIPDIARVFRLFNLTKFFDVAEVPA